MTSTCATLEIPQGDKLLERLAQQFGAFRFADQVFAERAEYKLLEQLRFFARILVAWFIPDPAMRAEELVHLQVAGRGQNAQVLGAVEPAAHRQAVGFFQGAKVD